MKWLPPFLSLHRRHRPRHQQPRAPHPCERVFAEHEQDKTLGEQFRAESSGILNWLSRGALLWHGYRLRDSAE